MDRPLRTPEHGFKWISVSGSVFQDHSFHDVLKTVSGLGKSKAESWVVLRDKREHAKKHALREWLVVPSPWELL